MTDALMDALVREYPAPEVAIVEPEKPRKQWFWIVAEADAANQFKPTIKDIQRSVCRHYPGITINDMLSARRTAAVVIPRQIAMFLSKEITLQSLPSIGRSFGDRDHTTVLHGVNKITRISPGDTAISKVIRDVREELGCP